VPTLNPSTGDAVLSYLLELACQAQNMRNIELGRTALLALPRAWLLDRIEAAAEPLLELGDEWEYRRLGEVYLGLDQELVRGLIARGRDSQDEGIKEAAEDFLQALDRA
jgi:hypothetical protein